MQNHYLFVKTRKMPLVGLPKSLFTKTVAQPKNNLWHAGEVMEAYAEIKVLLKGFTKPVIFCF